MIDKATRLLVPWIAMMGLMPSYGFSAEALPPRALARIGNHRFYHGPGIVCAVLSRDGRRAASAANYDETDFVEEKERDEYDRTIVLWDAASGERLREMRVPQGMVSQLAFSPDGKRLAASYGTPDEGSGVVLFDVETGKLFRQLCEFEAQIGHLQFSAEGKQLCVSKRGGPVSAWDVTTGKQRRLWEPPPSTTVCKRPLPLIMMEGVLSPDGRVIVWGMCYWWRKGGRFSAWLDGLRVHDAQTNKLLYEKRFIDDTDQEPHHKEFHWSFAVVNDEKRLIADCDDKLVVWEAATGRELATIKIPGIVRFAPAPDGRHAIIEEEVKGRDYSRLRLWDIQTGKPVRELLSAFQYLKYACTLPTFSADSKMLLIAVNSTLRPFDAKTGQEHAVPGHRDPVTPRISDDGQTLSTSCNEQRCRWDVSAHKPTLLRHESKKAWENERCLAYSADGQLFLDRSSDDHIRVCETATGRILHILPEGGRYAGFSPDSTRLLLYYEDSARRCDFRLFNVQTGKKTGEIQNAEKGGEPVFSPNGRFLAWVDSTGVVHLHDAATGKSVRTLRSSRSLPKMNKIDPDYRLHFSPDGELLFVAGFFIDRYEDGSGRPVQLQLRVFHVSSGREIAEFYANPEKLSRAAEISCMACSSDGRLLAVAEKLSGIIRVLEIASGLVRAEFAGHRHGVRGLAFSPDGKTLASGGEDNVVFLWDVPGTKTLSTIADNMSLLWNDLASEDGQRVGSAIATLLHKPEASVAFLRETLHPEEATSEKWLSQLIADLNSDAYITREAASRELTLLGERAEATLRRQLANRPNPEMRRRIEDILNKLEPSSPPPEILRTLRAIEVLEHAGTPAARQCLEALAKGAADPRQTRAAKTALQRLAKRR